MKSLIQMSIIITSFLIFVSPLVSTTQDDAPKIELEKIQVCGAQYYCVRAAFELDEKLIMIDSPTYLFFIQKEKTTNSVFTRSGFLIIPFHVLSSNSVTLTFSFLEQTLVKYECTVNVSTKDLSPAKPVCQFDGVTTHSAPLHGSMAWWVPDLTTDALMTCIREEDKFDCDIATKIKIPKKEDCKLKLEDTEITEFHVTETRNFTKTPNLLERDVNKYSVDFKITTPSQVSNQPSALVSLIFNDTIFEQKVSKKDVITHIDNRDYIPSDASVKIVVKDLKVHFCNVGKRKISIVGPSEKAEVSTVIPECLEANETNPKKNGMTITLPHKDSSHDIYVRERLPFSGALHIWKYSVNPNGGVSTTVPGSISKDQTEYCVPEDMTELEYVSHSIKDDIMNSATFKIKSQNKEVVASLKTCYPKIQTSTNKRTKIDDACEVYEVEFKFESEKIQELRKCKLMQINIENGNDVIVKTFFYEVVEDPANTWKVQKVNTANSESAKSEMKEKLKQEADKYIEEKAKILKEIIESGANDDDNNNNNVKIDAHEVGQILINQIQDTMQSISQLVDVVNSEESPENKEESKKEEDKKKDSEESDSTKTHAEKVDEEKAKKKQEEKETVQLSMIETKLSDIKVNITQKNITVVHFKEISKFEEMVVEITNDLEKTDVSTVKKEETVKSVKNEKSEKAPPAKKSSVKIKGNLMDNKKDVTVAYYKVQSAIKQKFATGIVVITDSEKTKARKSGSGTRESHDNNDDKQEKDVDSKNDKVIKLIFTVQTDSTVDHLMCSWIRGNMSTFRTDGCYTSYFLNKSNPMTEVTCTCNHLTSFAVLFGAETQHQPLLMRKIFSYLSYICTSISIALLSYIIFLKYSEKRTMKNREILYLAINYFCMYVTYLVADFSPSGSLACVSMKYISAFFVVHLYLTILLFGVRVYKNLITVSLQKSWIVQKSALILPTVLSMVWICITIGLTRTEHTDLCFISPHWSKILLLPIYVSVLVINSVIAVRAYLRIKARSQSKNSKEMDSTSKNLLIYLCMILGFTWFFQLLISIHYIFELGFILINGSQGVILYINLFKPMAKVKKSAVSMSSRISSKTRETSVKAFTGWNSSWNKPHSTSNQNYISFENL